MNSNKLTKIRTNALILCCSRTQSTVRVPRPGMDESVTYKDQDHVVVYRKGAYYKLDVFKQDSDGKRVQITIPELYTLLQQIVDMADGRWNPAIVASFTYVRKDFHRNNRQVRHC